MFPLFYKTRKIFKIDYLRCIVQRPYALKFIVNKERMLVIKIVLYKHYPAVKSQSHDYRPLQKRML